MANCFTQQAAVLAKLQGIGGQKIIVERVDVHQGGQAIVGNIQGGMVNKEKTRKQPQEPRKNAMPLNLRLGVAHEQKAIMASLVAAQQSEAKHVVVYMEEQKAQVLHATISTHLSMERQQVRLRHSERRLDWQLNVTIGLSKSLFSQA